MNPITAAAVGAGLMYLFDPQQGQSRRAKIQDQCANLASQSKAEFELSLRDLQHRAEDCVADLRSGVAERDPVPAIQHLREELTQWTPATRLLATAGGGALAACVLGAVAPRTLMLAGVGAGVCAAIMNNPQLQDSLAGAMQAAREAAESAQSIAAQEEEIEDDEQVAEIGREEPVRAEKG